MLCCDRLVDCVQRRVVFRSLAAEMQMSAGCYARVAVGLAQMPTGRWDVVSRGLCSRAASKRRGSGDEVRKSRSTGNDDAS